MFPQELLENEYIRLIAFKKKDGGERYQITKFVRSFADYELFINQHKHDCDIYNSLSTIRGKTDGTEANLFRRQVLCIDVDAKDYPDISSTKEHIARIKAIIPKLFNHAVVESGSGGVHLYFGIDATEDIDRVGSINKDLVDILGADRKAVLKTQIMRVPGTFNQKHTPAALVKLHFCSVDEPTYKKYELTRLETRVRTYRKSQEPKPEKINLEAAREDDQSTKPVMHGGKPFPCIEKLIQTGAPKGFRNRVLGRIANYLDYEGFSKQRAFEIITEWNERCTPPKPSRELRAEFERYWQAGYNLMGCFIKDDPEFQQYLNPFCDKESCDVNRMCWKSSNVEWKLAKLRRCEIKEDSIRKLTGNDYLILTVLHYSQNGLTVKEIEKWITNRNSKQPCMCRETLNATLQKLSKKYIEYDDFHSRWKIKSVYKSGSDIIFSFAACSLLINKVIKPREFRVYIVLVRNLRDGKSVTYDDISRTLNISEPNISEAIHGLESAHAIQIETVVTDKGVKANKYYLLV